MRHMILKKIMQSGFMFSLIIIIAACKREEFSWGIKVGDITYSGNVVFLGERELQYLDEITADQIVFSTKTGEVEKITDKSILVIGISEKTPYGSLRRVSSINSAGNILTIKTVEAFLQEAIKEGKIRFKRRLLEKDFRLISKAEGVKIREKDKSFDGLAVTLDNFAIYENGARSAAINGAVGISADINIEMEFKSNRLRKIDHTTSLNKIDEVTLVSNGPFSATIDRFAAGFVHSPVLIDSLIFVAEIKINCGFQGTVSSAVTSGVRQDRTISTGAHYLNTAWSDDQLSHTESFDFTIPLVTDDADLKVFTGPEITILLFGIPVQTIKADAYYSLNAQKSPTPSWKLFSGLNGHITVNNEILGTGQDHVINLIMQTSEIASDDDR